MNPDVPHRIRLADGDELYITVVDSPVGIKGAYRVRVLSTGGAMLVLPSASNSVELCTKRSLELESAAVKRAVIERDVNKTKQSADAAAQLLAQVDEEVTRLRALGWTKAQFARALQQLLEPGNAPCPRPEPSPEGAPPNPSRTS